MKYFTVDSYSNRSEGDNLAFSSVDAKPIPKVARDKAIDQGHLIKHED